MLTRFCDAPSTIDGGAPAGADGPAVITDAPIRGSTLEKQSASGPAPHNNTLFAVSPPSIRCTMSRPESNQTWLSL